MRAWRCARVPLAPWLCEDATQAHEADWHEWQPRLDELGHHGSASDLAGHHEAPLLWDRILLDDMLGCNTGWPGD